jgi:hypothetical protein
MQGKTALRLGFAGHDTFPLDLRFYQVVQPRSGQIIKKWDLSQSWNSASFNWFRLGTG